MEKRIHVDGWTVRWSWGGAARSVSGAGTRACSPVVIWLLPVGGGERLGLGNRSLDPVLGLCVSEERVTGAPDGWGRAF